MSNAIRMLPEPLRTVAAADVSNIYMGMGTGFEFPTRVFFMQNNTNALLYFSFDGFTDHFVLPEFSFLLIDVTTNHVAKPGGFYIAEGTRIYVKYVGSAPSTGAVYLSVFYGYDVKEI